MKALGDSMAAENGYLSMYGWQLYDTTGTTEDWSYYATGGLGFTFEIGDAGFTGGRPANFGGISMSALVRKPMITAGAQP
jgi:uncharacterized membrane protein